MNKAISVLLIIALGWQESLLAVEVVKPKCHGAWLNPITEVCWKCLFPLSIAGMRIADPMKDLATEEVIKKPFCTCSSPPRVGIPIGFWEPARVVDVTRIPFCMVNLGGLHIPFKKEPKAGPSNKGSGKHAKKKSMYHVHWYIYPLLVWFELVSILLCMQVNGLSEVFDLVYVTELDPIWDDDELSIWLNPEAALFSNPIAVAACAADCATSYFSLPLNGLFWCAGCQGGIYPLNGNIEYHTSGAEISTLLTEKIIFKLHRELLEWCHTGKKAMCSSYPLPWWKKTQYKLQMTYPRVNTGFFACNPIGRGTFIWDQNREFPYKGEDFGYLIWRRRDCCVF